MIVLDASVAVAGLIRDGAARQALSDEQVHVLHLIDSEVAHALHGLVTGGHLSDADGWDALDRWRDLAVTRHGVRDLLERIWELRSNVSAYDGGNIALAERLGCELVTADARLARDGVARCPVTVVPR